MGALIDRARQEVGEASAEGIHRAVFNGPYSASIHLLAGYSLELLLKSACYLHGGNAAKLKSKALRHDLTALLDEAEALGFVSSVAPLRLIAEGLRKAHLHHQFRYAGSEEVHMPELQQTLSALTGLYLELKDPLEKALKQGADASAGTDTVPQA
jgi:hypothetical protein